MKVFYHPSFTRVYTYDPAAREGRMEAVVEVIADRIDFESPEPADRTQISLAHTASHIEHVERRGLYDIAATAAGGAVAAARTGLTEPAFGLIRPPGHHASAGSAWGFCYFNNMAIALLVLKKERRIDTAMVLDVDLHFGDGTVNILKGGKWVSIHNPSARNRQTYLQEVDEALSNAAVDLIGVSAGFDYHEDDWGGLLTTEDYRTIAERVRRAARVNGGGCFGVLEGGYNHAVLGRNVAAFLEGLGA